MPTDPIEGYLHKKVYRSTMGGDSQTIPAKHGTATFVPAGSTIKIINTSGTQVIDTWAFALPSPPATGGDDSKQPNGTSTQEQKKPAPKPNKSKKGGMDLPSQEEAEAATAQGTKPSDGDDSAKKGSWSSYIPSMNLLGSKSDAEKDQVKQNSQGWGKYFSAGQGFSNYIPSKNSLSTFASSHYRDPNKPYIQQLSDFSKTPVGAAGMSALSGSGYASSLYAGYSAWTGGGSDDATTMEFLSMPHTHAATNHLHPKVGDVLVSNVREPMLTVLEDTAGVHDTLIAACDPQLYRQQGVNNWAEHGSCAENLVLALKELNERAGLKGPKGIGAAITINSIPQPLNLFMNVSCSSKGDLNLDSPKAAKGDHIRLRAERDVVVVMSACPDDKSEINAKKPADAHFLVEEELDQASDHIRKRLETASSEPNEKPKPVRRPARKLNGPTAAASSSKANTTTAARSKPTASSGHTPIGQKKTPPKASTAKGMFQIPPSFTVQ